MSEKQPLKIFQVRSILLGMDDNDLAVIPIKTTYTTIGPSPTVNIEGIYAGFDWNHGSVMFSPMAPVCMVDDKFTKSQQSIRDYEDQLGHIYNACIFSDIPDKERLKIIKQIIVGKKQK